MGSSASKPDVTDVTQVWTGPNTSVFSNDLTSHLASREESDVARQQALELEVQRRVTAELKRLQAEEAEALQEKQAKLSAPTSTDDTQDKPSRQTVSKEIETLRAKLEERRKVRTIPDTVEAARSEVVRCLRENDRRPLDCWKEVEQFKEEVRKLEKGWVDKVIS
ncbi:putative altered inheritance of mitochondria protein 13, mitochondrial [Rhypophila sp. PSN 637]